MYRSSECRLNPEYHTWFTRSIEGTRMERRDLIGPGVIVAYHQDVVKGTDRVSLAVTTLTYGSWNSITRAEMLDSDRSGRKILRPGQ